MTTPTSNDATGTTSAPARTRRGRWLTGAAVVAVAATAAGGLFGPGIGGADQTTAAPGGTNTGTNCGATARTPITQPTQDQMAASGLGKLPVASDSARLDLVAPGFSRPSEVTNALFPISTLSSAVLNGRVDGQDFRTETTLPETRTLEGLARGDAAALEADESVAQVLRPPAGSPWTRRRDCGSRPIRPGSARP